MNPLFILYKKDVKNKMIHTNRYVTVDNKKAP